MAKAFPKSQFFGFDYHDKSIEGARATAAKEGLEVRLNFGVAKAKAVSRQRLRLGHRVRLFARHG